MVEGNHQNYRNCKLKVNHNDFNQVHGKSSYTTPVIILKHVFIA